MPELDILKVGVNKFDCVMKVLRLEGSLEHEAHVWSEQDDLICNWILFSYSEGKRQIEEL